MLNLKKPGWTKLIKKIVSTLNPNTSVLKLPTFELKLGEMKNSKLNDPNLGFSWLCIFLQLIFNRVNKLGWTFPTLGIGAETSCTLSQSHADEKMNTSSRARRTATAPRSLASTDNLQERARPSSSSPPAFSHSLPWIRRSHHCSWKHHRHHRPLMGHSRLWQHLAEEQSSHTTLAQIYN